MISDLSIGVGWALAVLFALAVAHKLRLLQRGEAVSQPLLPTETWARHPKLYLVPLIALEVGLVVTLLLAPRWGLGIGAVVIAAYALALRRWLPPEAPCHCFGATSRTRRNVAVRRNAVLAALAAAAGVAATHDSAAEAERAIAVALIVLSIVGALEAVERLPHPETAKEAA